MDNKLEIKLSSERMIMAWQEEIAQLQERISKLNLAIEAAKDYLEGTIIKQERRLVHQENRKMGLSSSEITILCKELLTKNGPMGTDAIFKQILLINGGQQINKGYISTILSQKKKIFFLEKITKKWGLILH